MPRRTTFNLERESRGEWFQLTAKHPDGSTASLGCIDKPSFTAVQARVNSFDVSDRGCDLSFFDDVQGKVMVTSAKIRKGGVAFAPMSTAAWMRDIFLKKVLRKWPVMLASPLPTGAQCFLPNRDADLMIGDTSTCAVAALHIDIAVCTTAVCVGLKGETHQITLRVLDVVPPGFPTLARLLVAGGVELISTKPSSKVQSVVGGGFAAIYLTLGGRGACTKDNVYGKYYVCFVDVEGESKLITLTNQTVSIVQGKKGKRARGGS